VQTPSRSRAGVVRESCGSRAGVVRSVLLPYTSVSEGSGVFRLRWTEGQLSRCAGVVRESCGSRALFGTLLGTRRMTDEANER
jgi:hypothetical protein